MFKRLFLTCACMLIVMSFPLTHVSAHGTGVSYEESKDGYFIDIGHDEFIAKGEPVRFDFTTYPEDMDSIEDEVFTDVWVTITQNKQLFFAGGVHKPVFGVTGFTYAFPEEGPVTITARFQNEGETVVETSFPLEILPSLEEKGTIDPLILYVLALLSGLFIGSAITLFIPKKNKNT